VPELASRSDEVDEVDDALDVEPLDVVVGDDPALDDPPLDAFEPEVVDATVLPDPEAVDVLVECDCDVFELPPGVPEPFDDDDAGCDESDDEHAETSSAAMAIVDAPFIRAWGARWREWRWRMGSLSRGVVRG
jgi:hypothetical protein